MENPSQQVKYIAARQAFSKQQTDIRPMSALFLVEAAPFRLGAGRLGSDHVHGA